MAGNALISGASTGIGRATALHLDGLGLRVFAGVRRAEDGEALRSEASERLTPIPLDVTDEAQVDAAAKSLAQAVGAEGLRGLVNNAGIAAGGVSEFADLESLREVFEVNVFGLVRLTRAFLPLVRRGHGRVVQMGSNAGYLTSPFMAPYTATKHALEALSDGLRRELRPWGIHVALIEPGSVATPIWEKGREQAERIRRALPEHGARLYGPMFAAFARYVDVAAARGVPPARVAKAVAHALTAPRPRTRYRVGLDAEISWWMTRLLPDRVMDAAVTRLIGLPKTLPE